jgi:hypothetical protein
MIGQMSTSACEELNAWVPKKINLNIMGGEITILENYPEMLVALSTGRGRIRLVTNGFWGGRGTDTFFDAMRQIQAASCPRIEVAVSQDSWHDKPSHKAISLLKDNNMGIPIIEPGDSSVNDIVPVGRAWDNNLGGYKNTVSRCEDMCNMTITENGMICKCPFGYFPWRHFNETTWEEAQEYVYNWRSEQLKAGMNCRLCMETVQMSLSRDGDVDTSFTEEQVYV